MCRGISRPVEFSQPLALLHFIPNCSDIVYTWMISIIGEKGALNRSALGPVLLRPTLSIISFFSLKTGLHLLPSVIFTIPYRCLSYILANLSWRKVQIISLSRQGHSYHKNRSWEFERHGNITPRTLFHQAFLFFSKALRTVLLEKKVLMGSQTRFWLTLRRLTTLSFSHFSKRAERNPNHGHFD